MLRYKDDAMFLKVTVKYNIFELKVFGGGGGNLFLLDTENFPIYLDPFWPTRKTKLVSLLIIIVFVKSNYFLHFWAELSLK